MKTERKLLGNRPGQIQFLYDYSSKAYIAFLMGQIQMVILVPNPN